MIRDAATVACALAGCVFFAAGTVGLLRFPDVPSRLHALSKADNLGLGLVLAAVAAQADGVAVVAKLALIWLLALGAAATSTHLIASAAGEQPGRG